MSISKGAVIEIFAFFQIKEPVLRVRMYGKGQLNYTFLVECEGGKRYILQKINTIFNIAWVMKNINIVYHHLIKKQKEGLWDKDYKILTPKENEKGENYLEFWDNFWRVYDYLENTLTQDMVYYWYQAEKVGEIVWQFHLCLSDLKEDLYNPLPWFHYTPNYFADFLKIKDKTKVKRDEEIEAWILSHKDKISDFFAMIDSGMIKKRVTHNDVKVNNLLFDKKTGNPVCIIDWDTLSCDLPLWVDIGDMCRSLCANTGEEGDDFALVDFREDIFGSLMKGYLRKANSFLTEKEKSLILFSVEFIIFELSLRFYTDYLRGDTYFIVRYPLQNLEKAKKLYFLWKSFDSKREKLEEMLKKYI